MVSISLLKTQPEDIAKLFELENLPVTSNSKQSREQNNILRFELDKCQSFSVLVELFVTIFEDVLLMERLNEPDIKRSRSDSASFHEFKFSVNFPFWKGRRPIRRQLSSVHQHLTPLGLEKEVSREIRYKTNSSIEGCFPVIFDVILFSEDSFFYCDFRMDDQHLPISQDLLHFIATFLTRYLTATSMTLPKSVHEKNIHCDSLISWKHNSDQTATNVMDVD